MTDYPELPINTRADSLDVDGRVARVLGIVSRGEWKPGVTNRELQMEWSMTAAAVSACVAQAFRYIRMHRLGLEDDINRRLACIERDRELASQQVRYYPHKSRCECAECADGLGLTERPAPDVSTMLACDRLYLETIGALVRVKQLRGPDGEEQDVVGLVLIELQRNPAMLRAVLGQLQKSELRLLLERAGGDKVVVDAKDGAT